MKDRFDHQEREWRDHKYSRARALLWQMRTGKTRMAVESACALYDVLEIRGVLVVAPNGVHRQWAEEQIKLWGGAQNSAFAWRFADPQNQKKWELWRLFMSHDGLLRWLCVNMESLQRDEVRKAIAQFKAAVGRAMIVADEVHHFGHAGAKRTAVLRGLGRQFEYKRILTGTPVENSPLRAFSEFEILERGALGFTRYKDFKRKFAIMEENYGNGRHFLSVAGYQNLDILKRRMAPYSSVVLRSDCHDLPPLQMDRRIVEMTETQWHWWRTVKDKALEEAERLGQRRVFQGGAALVKLQQIEGGFWLHPDGRAENVCGAEDNPKMLILLDEIEQYDGQVIAWFEYVHELEAARDVLTLEGIRCGRFHGRMPTRERDDTLRAFKDRKLRVLLAQPRAGGEGRDLSAAGKMVWYSQPNADAVVRSQACERATVMGGESAQVVDMLTPVSRYLRDLAENKIELADDVSRRGLREILNELTD